MADTQEAPKKVFKAAKSKTPIKKKVPSTSQPPTPSVPQSAPATPSAPTETPNVEKSAKQASTKVSFLLKLVCLLSPTVLLLLLLADHKNSRPRAYTSVPKALLREREREQEKERLLRVQEEYEVEYEEKLRNYSLHVRALTIKQCRPRSSHLNHLLHLQLMFHNLK
jgi:hypothetical protein